MTTDKKPRQTRPKPSPDSFAQRLTDTMTRLNLDETRAAGYLGVPVFTLRKWTTGEREPGAAVVRLLDVLGLVEALAPGLHNSFVPAHVGRVKKSTLKNPEQENQP